MKKCGYLFFLILVCFLFSSDYGEMAPAGKRSRLATAKRDNCPVIDLSSLSVKPADCNQANGSITGITATGTGKLFYTWRNSSAKVVGSSLDLANVPADTYSLEVTDGSVCGKAFSGPVLVAERNGVNIDFTGIALKPASCNNDGSLTGVVITGATTIEWRIFGTTTIVGTSADLTNIPPGTYEVYASNSSCSKQAGPFVVPSADQVPSVQSVTLHGPTCKQGNGSISVTLLVAPNQPRLDLYWEDSSGAVISNSIVLAGEQNPVLTLQKLDWGDYYLYAVGSDKCFILLGKYNLPYPSVAISLDSASLIEDRCNQHIGYLQVNVVGGTPPRPTSAYYWTDSTGAVISKLKYASDLGAGTYTIHYVDVNGCDSFASFTVTDSSPPVPPPVADGTTLCLPGQVAIAVKNADTAGIYRLYASVTDTIPLDTSKRGLFYRTVKKTTDFYIAKGRGDCESTRTKVTITVVADINIPNAFTPNNDGVNDVWNLAGIDKFPGATVDVFTRDGKLVFHSLNYPKPFDGQYNGAQLPTGVYYYVIDVKVPICFGKISGSLTIIR